MFAGVTTTAVCLGRCCTGLSTCLRWRRSWIDVSFDGLGTWRGWTRSAYRSSSCRRGGWRRPVAARDAAGHHFSARAAAVASISSCWRGIWIHEPDVSASTGRAAVGWSSRRCGRHGGGLSARRRDDVLFFSRNHSTECGFLLFFFYLRSLLTRSHGSSCLLTPRLLRSYYY